MEVQVAMLVTEALPVKEGWVETVEMAEMVETEQMVAMVVMARMDRRGFQLQSR